MPANAFITPFPQIEWKRTINSFVSKVLAQDVEVAIFVDSQVFVPTNVFLKQVLASMNFPFTINQLLTLCQICSCTGVTQRRQYYILEYISILNGSVYFALYKHLTSRSIKHSLIRTKPLNKTAYRE